MLDTIMIIIIINIIVIQKMHQNFYDANIYNSF